MGSKKKEAMKTESKEPKKRAGVNNEAKEHIGTLKRLEEKDPEFYAFLKEQEKELLEFDEDVDDSVQQTDTEGEEEEETEVDDAEQGDNESEKEEPRKNVITSAMVDSWCSAIQDGAKLGAVRSILRAFRSACHYGDENGDESTAKFSIMSSGVFNKIMLFVLNEMDGILRGLLKLPSFGGNKEMILDLTSTRKWKNYNSLVKSYLGNSLHILNQMTDNEMVAFVLRRMKYSAIFLAAFPVLLRKYIKVALHFWGTGSGALPVVSFLFIRDICIRLGGDCLDDCIKGMYKAYIMNCQFVNSANAQDIHFLSNCFGELLRIDIPSAYQHAFTYIRQLAIVLMETLSGSTKKKSSKNKSRAESSHSKKIKGKDAPSKSAKKEAFRQVYRWKYIYCLELWTGVICANSSEPDIRSLAYPLVQIVTGVARLVLSTCYFPLRLRCIRMLNRIGAATNTFIPISLLLLDMLEIKELRRSPTGGVGQAVDWSSILKVSKATLKTRAFQEACVFSVVEELAEHLSQWSYSIAFMELSLVPCVRLRDFCKSTKVERFQREVKQLIRQIESNSDYVNKNRATASFLPNSIEASAFLEDDKKSGKSPLSQYTAGLHQRANERNGSLRESSVLIGDGSSKFGSTIPAKDEDDIPDDIETPVFSLPVRSSRNNKNELSDKRAQNEDIIEDLVLSSDEDDAAVDNDDEDSEPEDIVAPMKQVKKPNRRRPTNNGKKNTKSYRNKTNKRKRSQR